MDGIFQECFQRLIDTVNFHRAGKVLEKDRASGFQIFILQTQFSRVPRRRYGVFRPCHAH
jgi:hypothetical protein